LLPFLLGLLLSDFLFKLFNFAFRCTKDFLDYSRRFLDRLHFTNYIFRLGLALFGLRHILHFSFLNLFLLDWLNGYLKSLFRNSGSDPSSPSNETFLLLGGDTRGHLAFDQKWVGEPVEEDAMPHSHHFRPLVLRDEVPLLQCLYFISVGDA